MDGGKGGVGKVTMEMEMEMGRGKDGGGGREGRKAGEREEGQ